MTAREIDLAFGAARRREGRALSLAPGLTPALRLSDAGRLLGLADGAGRTHTRQDQVDAVREMLAAMSDPWSRSARQFLDGYFAFVDDTVSRRRDDIARRLAPHGDMFTWRDAVFSALLPLPRAHLRAGDAWHRAAACFWTGARLVCVDVRPARSGAVAMGEATAMIALDPADLDDPAHLAAALPDDLRDFWRAQVLPRGPLGTRLPDSPPG